MGNSQMKGASSNTAVGKEFEKTIIKWFKNDFKVTNLECQKRENIGISGKTKKFHKFDFGNDKLVVECKNYQWTNSGNVPSAKISTMSEAMYYLSLCDKEKKIFVIKKGSSPKWNETLLGFFVKNYNFLIPKDVVLVEYANPKDYEVYAYEEKKNEHVLVGKGYLKQYLS